MKNDVRLGKGGPLGQQGGAASAWRAVTRFLRSPLHDLVSALAPGDCHLCDAPLLRATRVPVCDGCLDSVSTQNLDQLEFLCTTCGVFMGLESVRFTRSLGLSGRLCTTCRLAPPRFARAVAFADYDAEVRDLLHLLKFSQHRPTADFLGQRLAQAILLLHTAAATELTVVPVPLFRARERSRGFNQSTLLAQAAIQSLRKTRPRWHLTLAANALTRTRETASLYALKPHERRQQLRGAFRVTSSERIANREVLLVDDILTTGATARECARVLVVAGAAKVWVATVARAQPLDLFSTHNPSAHVAHWDAQPSPAGLNPSGGL